MTDPATIHPEHIELGARSAPGLSLEASLRSIGVDPEGPAMSVLDEKGQETVMAGYAQIGRPDSIATYAFGVGFVLGVRSARFAATATPEAPGV